MGGTSAKAATIKPDQGYYSGLLGSIQLGQGLVNAAAAATPELRTADIPRLQDIAYRESLINAMKSAEMEKLLTPDIANTREELSRQVNQDLSEAPDTNLSNMWLRSGLADIIATGAGTDSGFARSALADKTRSDYFTNRLMNQNKAGQLLAANPQPISGLDPGALASADSAARAGNISARENYAAQILAALSNQANNATNAMQQGGQYAASIAAANANAQNQMRAANASNTTALWGAGIGAGGNLLGGLLGGF